MNLSAMQETWVLSLGQEDPLEEGMATQPNILAWRIQRAEEPDRLQSMGSQRAGHDCATKTRLCSQQIKISSFELEPHLYSLLESSSKCLLSLLQNQGYSQLPSLSQPPSLSFSWSLPFSSLPLFVINRRLITISRTLQWKQSEAKTKHTATTQSILTSFLPIAIQIPNSLVSMWNLTSFFFFSSSKGFFLSLFFFNLQ